jgi:hypothetical protein
MKPNQEKFFKTFVRLFFSALAIYLIFWHPLFVLLTLIIIFLAGYFLISNGEKVRDFFDDMFNR